MLKNYFKIAWRNLLRNKVLAFINIFGLAVGMAFAILIGLWIQYEMSVDTFHKNSDQLAIVSKNYIANDKKGTTNTVPLPLYYELKNSFPEVKRLSRMDWGNTHSIVVGDKKFNRKGSYVDTDFLQMFSFPLIAGNPRTALNDPNAIVLTASLATALFGEEDPMGKMVKIDNRYQVKVSGIAKDVPANSSLQFEFLAPFAFKVQNFDWIKNSRDNWGNNFLHIFIEIKQGASMEMLSTKIGQLISRNDNEIKDQVLFLFPLEKWHLYGNFENWVNVGGRINYVRLFGIIGIFILLIACINFMNLATARSEKRAKEVGIRKAIGSQRIQLIIQFMSESLLTTFLAFFLSIALVWIMLPYLKNLGFENSPGLLSLSIITFSLAASIITGLMASSYPALYLSSFLPVKVLKGVTRQGRGTINVRKVLVVSQFSISIGLIICTVIVFQQIQYAKNRSIGYKPDSLITIGASTDLAKNYAVLKQDLLNTGYLEAVSKASSPMTSVYNSWASFSWIGKDPENDISFDVIMTEWDYEKTVGIHIKQGRAFSRDYATDSSAALLNEAAVKMIGFKEPIGKTIKMDDKSLTIIGVVENVVMEDPFKPVAPAIILFMPQNISEIFLRLKPAANVKQALAVIGPIIEKYNPAYPFEYSFVDEDFERKFTTENQVGTFAGIFAGLAIFLSCLGLFGLAAFMAERRTKEIGIRKVVGASIVDLWLLLSKEFVWLVLIACVIAAPIAYWMMTDWLQHYDYRIRISWWVFGMAGFTALLITLLTISFQTVKAALGNPVKSVKSEV